MDSEKKILVTGCAGFIGSHLAQGLLNKGYSVIGLDNLCRGTRENMPFLKDERFQFVEGDICNPQTLMHVLNGVDCVFHLAARIHVDESIKEPHLYYRNNVESLVDMLNIARELDVPRFIFASSSEVYGTARYSPMDEDHPLNPASPYAATKAAGDRTCFAYYYTFGQDITIVRNFNTFGPRQKSDGYGGAIGIFTQRSLDGKNPIVFGDGLQTRDYMFVEDAVQAYLKVMDCNQLKGEAVNFGTGIDHRILDVAHKIAALSGRDLKVEHAAPRPGEVLKLCADTKKAREKLGFQPKYSFEKGLEEYVEWFKSAKAK